MPRPRGPNFRVRNRKPASPELEAMVDTIEDSVNPEPRPTRAQKAGPKKVLGETTKIFGYGASIGIMLLTSQPDARKNLTKEEAESLGHPVVRMLARRIPAWLKPFLPKTKLNAEDAADIEEILATMGKWSVRLVKIMVEDFLTQRETAPTNQQKTHAKQEANTVESVASTSFDEQQPIITAPSPQGHNPAFDILRNIDLGMEAA